ncbi:hypothetical protein SAMN05216436_103149 [bacterium A37T11]|nr:hypothetical protein SAMN05216436_103149 [bacterium A37T11]
MGSYERGILGSFSGKVGSVVGSHWRGIDYMRSLPRKGNRSFSQAQQEQQLKFALAVNFMKPISSLVNLGFKNQAKQRLTGYNVAVQYTIKKAITGVFPDFVIDYPKVQISEGPVPPSTNAAAESTAAATLHVTWVNNALTETNAMGDDQVILLVYNEAKSRYLYTVGDTIRETAEQEMTLPTDFTGDTVHVYISFVRRDGSKLANSTYVSAVVIL